MAQYRTISEFLLKLRQSYEKAREEYTILNDKLQDYNNWWNAELTRGWGSQEKKKDDTRRYESRKEEMQAQIREHIRKSYAEFEAIRTESEAVFAPFDRANIKQIHPEALELMKSGILREDEIRELAKEFDRNCTMLRLIGKYAVEQGNKDNNHSIRNYGMELQNYHFPYKDHIGELIRWSKKCLREDREASDRSALFYEKTYNELSTASDGIYITVSE